MYEEDEMCAMISFSRESIDFIDIHSVRTRICISSHFFPVVLCQFTFVLFYFTSSDSMITSTNRGDEVEIERERERKLRAAYT